MNRRHIIGIAVLVLVLVAIVATRGFGLFAAHDNAVLTLSGNVDIRQVDLAFRVSGRIAQMPFEEGSHVEQGAVIARLDPSALKDARAAADAQVGVAQAELRKRRAGNRPQDIAQAQAKLAETEATLANAREEYERRSGLVKTGAVSEAVFEASRARYRAAQAQVAAARQALSLQHAGARTEDIASAAAQQRLAIAQRDKADTDLNDAVLRAPNAGIVLTRVREPGAVVQSGETVATLTIDRPMRIRAYVGEPDLSRVAPGMAVTVTADGNPKRYQGTIGFIAPTAEFTPKTVQTQDLRTDLVYRVRIIVQNPDNALRQGQPVTVTLSAARPARDQ
ncbi:MAG TPA: HlyD family efflux transporter periplasmic adaptor subunit [Sphingobium sp.]|nr:HlyD family efflux transporter periplasmic adaptor subunit [Sphingobium sp.]